MSSSFSGWWYTYPYEKYEFVSWDDYSRYSQYMKKTCSKPPTTFMCFFFVRGHPRSPTGRYGQERRIPLRDAVRSSRCLQVMRRSLNLLWLDRWNGERYRYQMTLQNPSIALFKVEPTARNVDVTVLSMDTAVSVTYGNLSWQAASWTQLVACYERGWVSATLAGTPCETFSEARFQDGLPDLDNPDQRRLPGPLRSYERLLGLSALTRRELEQLGTGSMFFLQGLLLLSYQIVGGGCFISEHPAPPWDASRPSIWTSPWLQVLRQHPDLKLHMRRSGRLELVFLSRRALRLPMFTRSLYRHADPAALRPTAVAIGRKSDGTFKTSEHKEYPSRFCAGLAQAITDFLDHNLRTGRARSVPSQDVDFDLHRWIVEAKEACEEIRQGAAWLPDYQRL